MRNTLMLLAAAVMLAAFSGCASPMPLFGTCKNGPGTCTSCCGDPDSGAPCKVGQGKPADPSDPGVAGPRLNVDRRCWLDRKANPGVAPCREHGVIGCKLCCAKVAKPAASPPPPGVVTYPYYTTRGPRDFLDRNPQPIGP
jgi:hypothetical protein